MLSENKFRRRDRLRLHCTGYCTSPVTSNTFGEWVPWWNTPVLTFFIIPLLWNHSLCFQTNIDITPPLLIKAFFEIFIPIKIDGGSNLRAHSSTNWPPFTWCQKIIWKVIWKAGGLKSQLQGSMSWRTLGYGLQP